MGLFNDDKTPQSVQVAGLELRCRICQHGEFWQREAQMNTAVATFFNFDWANRTATCYVCERCGYVHWFLDPS